MKKLIFFFFILVFFSCEKSVDESLINNIYQDEPTLDFSMTIDLNSKEDLVSFLNGSNLKAVLNKPHDFISMNDVVCDVDGAILDRYDYTELSKPKEEIRFYDLLKYEELVPNENFSALLNTRGEITVDNTLYRITEFGTFYCEPQLQSDLDIFYNDLTTKENSDFIGIYVDEQTIRVKEGIYLVDTYGLLNPEVVDDFTYNFPELDDYIASTTNSPSTNNGLNIPGIDKFPRFKSGAKTVAGKIVSSLFGDNSYKTVKLSSKRKLRAKLYDYNYKVYQEIGGYVDMRKKNKIGWSGTSADELVLGWRNVILELDTKVPDMPVLQSPAYSGHFTSAIPGFDKQGTCLSIMGLDITNAQFLKALKAGKKPLVDWLKANTANGNTIGNINPDAIFMANKNKVYVVVLDQSIRNYGKESLRKVFSSNFSFFFSIDLAKMPNNILSWAKTMKDIGKLPVKSLKEGEVVCAGRLRNNWAGMIIYK